MKSFVLAAAVLLGGCTLYFDSGDDDDCALVGAPEFAPPELREPFTGQCQSFDSPCNSGCGPCAEDAAAIPDWGSCFSQCEALDELTCTATAGCRAAYNANSTIDRPPQFLECWAIAPSGPAQGACENLDAYECSRHDDCGAYYDVVLAPDDGIERMSFSSCRAETTATCTSDEQCGAGAHCSTSDGECLPCDAPDGTSCPAVCFGRCVMDQDSCANVDCGQGSHCEQQCQGSDGSCSPVCVPDGDSCASTTCPTGSECVQTCTGQDPNNPGCGVCTVECVPTGTCAGVGTEAECLGRGDCTAVYTGEDCTCYPNGGCTCEILTYARCE